MRPLALLLLLAAVAQPAPAAEPPATPSWPLWDGHESIAEYSKRAKLEPTRTLDLGNGIKMELALIPAEKFVMGTEEPKPVDEGDFRKRIITGQAALGAGGGVLLVFLAVIAIRAIRQRRRPQYSLARLLAMIMAAGVGLGGGMHWWESARAFSEARAEYQAAMARYKEADNSEKPAHEVILTKPFYLGKFELTQEQFQQVMGGNPSYFKGRDLPVENVSWDEAQEFCKKASEKTGHAIRLPTDAEWEFACRAGTRTAYYTGDGEADLDRAGWYGENSGGTTHPVGQKVPNAWGLYDMYGNVWEWCVDWYGDYSAEAVTDPQGPVQGQYRVTGTSGIPDQCRVVRGGSWGFDPKVCRSAIRFGLAPGFRDYIVGFRLAADVPPKAP